MNPISEQLQRRQEAARRLPQFDDEGRPRTKDPNTYQGLTYSARYRNRQHNLKTKRPADLLPADRNGEQSKRYAFQTKDWYIKAT